MVPVGTQGEVRLLLQSPQALTRLQVKFDTQVVGEVLGEELRSIRAFAFSVPRIPGMYNLVVAARDRNACENATTLARSVTVQ